MTEEEKRARFRVENSPLRFLQFTSGETNTLGNAKVEQYATNETSN